MLRSSIKTKEILMMISEDFKSVCHIGFAIRNWSNLIQIEIESGYDDKKCCVTTYK